MAEQSFGIALFYYGGNFESRVFGWNDIKIIKSLILLFYTKINIFFLLDKRFLFNYYKHKEGVPRCQKGVSPMGQEDASQKQKYWKLENIKCNFTKEVFQMRKHSWLKKSIASLLALIMILSVIPMTVFAEEEPNAKNTIDIMLPEGENEIVISVLKTQDGRVVLAPTGTNEETELIQNGAVRASAPMTVRIIRMTSMHVYIQITVPDLIGT